MPGAAEDEQDACYRRAFELVRSVPPGERYLERVLDKLHGPGWKQRAMAVGPLTLQLMRRVAALESRLRRLERELDRKESSRVEWQPSKSIEPLKGAAAGEAVDES